MNKKTISLFLRSFLFSIMVLVCVMAVIAGFALADSRTDSTVSSDKSKAVGASYDKDVLQLQFLGKDFLIDTGAIKVVYGYIKPFGKLIPPEYRLAIEGFLFIKES